MMRNSILCISVLVALSVFMSGCGQPKPKVYATKPPNLIKLKPYAITDRSKYLHKLITQVNTNPDLIPSIYVDPKKDENVKIIANKKYNEFKKEKKKYAYGLTKPEDIRQLRSIKKFYNKPFWLMTDIPDYIENGYIRKIPKNVMTSITMKESKAVYLDFATQENQSINELYSSILLDLESFLLHDSGWIKQSESEAYKTMPSSIKKILGDESYKYEWKIKDIIVPNILWVILHKKNSYISIEIKNIVYEK